MLRMYPTSVRSGSPSSHSLLTSSPYSSSRSSSLPSPLSSPAPVVHSASPEPTSSAALVAAILASQSEQNQGRVESTTDASMAGTAHSWW